VTRSLAQERIDPLTNLLGRTSLRCAQLKPAPGRCHAPHRW
jgi:hypothetical protein